MQVTRRTKAAMAAVAVAALVVAGCGSDSDGAQSTTTAAPADPNPPATGTTAGGDDATTTTGATVEATTTTGAGGEETTSTTESSEGRDTETSELDTLSDGDHVGHIAGVENGVVEGQDVQVILFDEVTVLTGQEAIDAAAEDGVTLDTDYYVSDPDAGLVSIAVVPEAQVTTLDGGSANQVPSSVSEIANAGEDALFTINTSTVRDVTLVNSISGYYLA